jgi:hypothetical protein
MRCSNTLLSSLGSLTLQIVVGVPFITLSGELAIVDKMHVSTQSLDMVVPGTRQGGAQPRQLAVGH